MKYYDTYQFEIHDTFSAGLTLQDEDRNGFEVMIGEKTLLRDAEYIIEKTEHSFVLSIENLKGISGIKKDDLIRVNYSARLNQDAVTGNGGNVNEAYLEYSNNPNNQASTGKTPADKTMIFTYELDVLKVDGNSLTENIYQTKLSDAEFVLYQMEGEKKVYVCVDTNGKVCDWIETKPVSGNLKTAEDGTFIIADLDDGVYYLEETKAPSGYKLLRSPVKITIAAATVHGQDGVNMENLSDLMVKVDTNLTDSIEEENGMSGDVVKGNVNVTIENFKGAILPSTGDQGTVLLYGFGSLMLIVSIIYFTLCKRKETKNDFI